MKVTAIGRHDDENAFPTHANSPRSPATNSGEPAPRDAGTGTKIEVAYYLCTWDQRRLPAAQLARAAITGGSGIGRATAELFVAEDATVVVADIGELTYRHTDITVEAEEITVTGIMTTASGVPREKDEESTAGRRRSPWAAG